MPVPVATFEVRGLKELDTMLRALPTALEGEIMDAALREAGGLILRAAQRNIHSRTGRTAADVRMDVQVQPGRQQGLAVIGGTRGKTGRAYILRWLEFGTAKHPVVAGQRERAEGRRAARALRAIGQTTAAKSLQRGLRTGAIRTTRALKLPGGKFRAAAKIPATRPQSPLTRALAEEGGRALRTFRDTIWRGLAKVAQQGVKAA